MKDLLALSSKKGLYVVGGTLRDHFLGKEPSDWDFCAPDAPRLARLFSSHIKGRLIGLDETPGRETFRVATGGGLFFDFSEMQGNSIEQDLAARDFTFNAMALPAGDFLEANWEPIDPYHGRDDLENKIVRVVPGPIFEADPLRVIRAFRFAATLGFEIEKDTLAKISRSQAGLSRVAAERISYELLLFLGSKNSSPLVRLMNQTGVLAGVFPEFKADTKDEGAARTAESLETLETLERLISRPRELFQQNFSRMIGESLSGKKHALLKLAALLYSLDAGRKPQPVAAREKPGVSTQETVLKRLRFSNADIQFILQVMRFQKIALSTKLDFAGAANDVSRVYSFVKESGEEFVPSLLLAAATHLARSGEPVPFVRAIHHLVEFHLQRFLPARNQPVLLTGDDLIHRFKLSPSPLFKSILDQIEEARVTGAIETREQAEALAQNLIQTSPPGIKK